MGFFDSEKYILSMYVAISIVTLLILFNFVGIFENSQGINNNKIILKDKIKSFTGFANLDDSENLEDENLDDSENLEDDLDYLENEEESENLEDDLDYLENEEESENLDDENQTPFKSYFIYYSIIGILGFFILLIIFKIFRG